MRLLHVVQRSHDLKKQVISFRGSGLENYYAATTTGAGLGENMPVILLGILLILVNKFENNPGFVLFLGSCTFWSVAGF